MPDMIQSRGDWVLWLGFLLALGALLCNAVFFVNLPGQRAILWLSVLLAGVSLIFLVGGLKRAFGQPRVYRGKILSSILALVALLLGTFLNASLPQTLCRDQHLIAAGSHATVLGEVDPRHHSRRVHQELCGPGDVMPAHVQQIVTAYLRDRKSAAPP